MKRNFLFIDYMIIYLVTKKINKFSKVEDIRMMTKINLNIYASNRVTMRKMKF